MTAAPAPRPRTLVTGSEGFVGRHLRRELSRRGHEIIGLDRPGTGAEITLDLAEKSPPFADLAARCGPVDAIIHMAATITRGSSVDLAARRNLQAIALAPLSLVAAFARLGAPPHLVLCSTYKTYGPPARLPIDPEEPPQRPDPHSYGSAKLLGERLVRAAGLAHAVVRPTCIYGPGQHLHNAIPRFLRAALGGERPTIFGEGRDVRDDVYAPDLAWLLAEAAERRATGSFHAGGERARTILETAEACCEAVAQLRGSPPLAPRLDPSCPPKWWIDQTFDGQSAARLGYRPTPLAEGLREEARWIAAPLEQRPAPRDEAPGGGSEPGGKAAPWRPGRGESGRADGEAASRRPSPDAPPLCGASSLGAGRRPTVLVTGATGRLGSRLIEALRQGGHRVIGVSRSGQPVAGAAGLACDLREEAAVGLLAGEIDAATTVVHLASAGENAGSEEILETGVPGAMRVLEASRGARRVVVVGRGDLYEDGQWPGDGVPSWPRSPRGLAQAATADHARALAAEEGVDVAEVRALAGEDAVRAIVAAIG